MLTEKMVEKEDILQVYLQTVVNRWMSHQLMTSQLRENRKIEPDWFNV